MNTVVRIGIIFCAVITLALSSSTYGQSYNRAVVLRNLEADTVALYPPASGLSSYHLTLPANAPSLGSLWYVADALRGLGWITPGNENDVFQVVGGIPSWQNPNSALDDNFVRYNIGTTQSLATTTGGNFLFNVEYGTTNAASAAGARINSLTTLANSNATGLTLNATATGTGTSRGLVVTTSGGTNNYAATFSGKVGIGIANPTPYVEIKGPDIVTTTMTPSNWTDEATMKVTHTVNPPSATTSGFNSVMAIDSIAIEGGSNLSTARLLGRFIRMNSSQTNAILELRPLQTSVNLTQSASISEINTLYSDIIASAGTTTRARNIFASINCGGSGAVDTAFGAHVYGVTSSTGNINNYYGFYVGPLRQLNGATGTMTNATGLYVADMSSVVSPGTRNAFLYDGTGTHFPVAITGDGRLGVGLSTPSNGMIEVYTHSSTELPFSADNFGTSASVGSEIRLRRARGSSTSPSAVSVNDRLGGLRIGAYHGAGFSSAGRLTFLNDASISGTNIPAEMQLLLNDGNAEVMRLRVSSNGRVSIGANIATAKLDIDGGLVIREDASITNVNSDNFSVTVGDRSYLRIGSTTVGAGATKTLTLSDGLRIGQILIIEAVGAQDFEIADNSATNNTSLSANRIMTTDDVITLLWNGSDWLEVNFSSN